MNSASPLRVHWSHPDPSSTPLFAFREYVNQRRQLRLSTFDDIQEWATSDIEAFAEDFWNFSGVIYSESPRAVGVGLDQLWPPPTWFPGAALNYAENLLAFGLKTKPNSIAVAAYEEGDITGSREPLRLTFRQLEDEVARWAHALKRLGVGVGDPVGGTSTPFIRYFGVVLTLCCVATQSFCRITSMRCSSSWLAQHVALSSPQPRRTWGPAESSTDIDNSNPSSLSARPR